MVPVPVTVKLVGAALLNAVAPDPVITSDPLFRLSDLVPAAVENVPVDKV